MLDVVRKGGVVARTAGRRIGATRWPGGSDPAMLSVARRIRPDLRWQVGDAQALPFGDGAFDLVLSQAA